MQDRRAGLGKCRRAFIFLAKFREERPLCSLDFRCAQCAIGVEQVALSQSCEHRAFNIAICVAGLAARNPCEGFFEEGHRSLNVPEEVIVEAAECAICPNERAGRRYSFCVNRDSLKSALMKRHSAFANAAFSAAPSHSVAVKSASVKGGRVSALVSNAVIVLVRGLGVELRCEGLRIG